ncbi:hypothetical protein ABZ890_47220 [Streptomyces sp. NPDC046984]|uniref:hypothetical protein n=1 Tax=Streptomyces sp. NPDC046984 TaxID=3155138 RepID=UPI0033C72697
MCKGWWFVREADIGTRRKRVDALYCSPCCRTRAWREGVRVQEPSLRDAFPQRYKTLLVQSIAAPFGKMLSMELLPIPCPAELIPDVTEPAALNAACSAAREQGAVFVGIEREGYRWIVKADELTAPEHGVDTAIYGAVRIAVIHLIHSREIRPDSTAGPIYFALYGVDNEYRARELAAALHAALYGDLGPLSDAVPDTSA